MTTLEVVDTVGSWKLGGTYEDESAANTQLRILNIVNIARQSVLREYYIKAKTIPQICYQEFDIDVNWTEQEGCLSFVATIPQVMSFPEPQVNGWDSIVPICENAMPLTEVQTQNQLRQYRNNSIGKRMRTAGWFLTTGSQLSGYLKPKVKSEGLVGRAILATPQEAQGFNIEKDFYPLPEDMLNDIKRFIETQYARRWAIANSQISDSKTTVDNGRG